MTNKRNFKSLAFGVEPGLPPFRLRQARYQALAEDVARHAQDHFARTGRKLDLLDVGVGDGVSMRYLEVNAGAEHIRYHGVDLFPKGAHRVYKADQWRLTQVDLEHGMPQVPSERYDLVICEQVLEHLQTCEQGLSELIRVLRPGGLLIVGVPIFAHGVHQLRAHLVRLLRLTKPRGHVQSFSQRSFLRMLDATAALEVQQVRGFRIVSGGILRPLEYYRWWWRLNRRLGALVPSLCVEIQVIARKKAARAAVALRRAA
jgi:ubiquinone/menaquinone biosynthesis C-methylase UbiE